MTLPSAHGGETRGKTPFAIEDAIQVLPGVRHALCSAEGSCRVEIAWLQGSGLPQQRQGHRVVAAQFGLWRIPDAATDAHGWTIENDNSA